jgi:hypothetical protein
MCFSSTASFLSSAVLTAIGSWLIWKYKGTKKLLLASIPLFFGLQQFSEGMVWLDVTSNIDSKRLLFFKNIFLFFAYIFWPIWVPLSLRVLETLETRKKILNGFVILGFLLGINALFYVFDSPLKSHRFSIDYLVTIKVFGSWFLYCIFYITTTVVSFFISSKKLMGLFGIFVGLLAIITYSFDKSIGASLWCFFSAIASISLVFLIKNK